MISPRTYDPQRITHCLATLAIVWGCSRSERVPNRETSATSSETLLADPEVGRHRASQGIRCTTFPISVEQSGCDSAQLRPLLEKLTARLVACARVHAEAAPLDGKITLKARIATGGRILDSRAWSTGAVPAALVSCFRDFSGLTLSKVNVQSNECAMVLTFDVNRSTCPVDEPR